MFEIRVKIDREEDLYCGFDEAGATLSDDVLSSSGPASTK